MADIITGIRIICRSDHGSSLPDKTDPRNRYSVVALYLDRRHRADQDKQPHIGIRKCSRDVCRDT